MGGVGAQQLGVRWLQEILAGLEASGDYNAFLVLQLETIVTEGAGELEGDIVWHATTSFVAVLWLNGALSFVRS